MAEHPSNPDLLFAGTHNSLYISLNRGLSWVRPETNLPYIASEDPNGIVITYYLDRTYKKGSGKHPVINKKEGVSKARLL